MSKIIVVLLATCLTVKALPRQSRIAGGVIATDAQYPFAAAIFSTQNSVNFNLVCGGTILNSRSVMTATSCWTRNSVPNQLRIRVGSINAHTGGTVHYVARILSATQYDDWNRNNNIGILRVVALFQFGINVGPAQLAHVNFNLGDNQPATTIGWGQTAVGGAFVNHLRWVEVRTVNQITCQNIYGVNFVSANMMCAGWQFNQNTTRGACDGDIGSPLLHNNAVVVGITSFTYGCGDVNYPAVYTRVTRYNNWILNNA